MTDRKDKKLLLDTSQELAALLKPLARDTRLRIRAPHRVVEMATGGWRAVIGDLGKGSACLEVWFDRFTGYAERKFYAGFRSSDHNEIRSLSRASKGKLSPIRTIASKDLKTGDNQVLAKRLTRSEFAVPILERYEDSNAYFGFFDPTRGKPDVVNRYFCERAAAFFIDVATPLPSLNEHEAGKEVYPQIENRRKVVSHLRRERSKLLPLECKRRDDYQCRICSMRFEETYGKIGVEFAEAHHMVPLSTLTEAVITTVDDLITVCANCHRMLHKMEGKPDDVKKLKALVAKARRK